MTYDRQDARRGRDRRVDRPGGTRQGGQDPPRAKRYRIRIDREHKEVSAPGLKGREILALVGKTPETHMLSQKLRGGQSVPVAPDQFVDFTAPGIQRFQTLALDPTEG